MSSLFKHSTHPAAGTQISTSGGGSLDKVLVAATSSGTIKFWDTAGDRGNLELGGGTAIIGTFTPAAGASYDIEATFTRGLYVDTGGTSIDITTFYNGDSVR